MADFQNAGYRLLSFKYIPTLAEKEQAVDDDKVHQGEESPLGDGGLHSLSSLLNSLQEIEGSDDFKTKHESRVKLREQGKEFVPRKTKLCEFHLFNDLPAEIRLRVWDLTFLPRVVEVRPPRAKYSQGQWQSGCSNPAALAVSIEAREAALAHFRIPFPLDAIVITSNTDTAQQRSIEPIPFQAVASPYTGPPLRYDLSNADNSIKTSRTLYVSPEHDTVCLLGQDWDSGRISHVMRTFREADPLGSGIGRLGLTVRAWGFAGSVEMMKDLGTTSLRELVQLVLFMYGEQHPPPAWRAKGSAMVDGEEQERYRREGNRCELISCEHGAALHAYKVWAGARGRQFWGEDGNLLRIGRKGNKIQFMDLEFKAGW